MNQVMATNCWDVPPPMLFHPLKHHLGYLRYFVQNSGKEEFLSALPRIGASQMDVYGGELSPWEIGQEIYAQLQAKDVLSDANFRDFLNSDGFQTLVLTDASHWTLRWGNEPGLYVHIHPGRYAQHCVRVKAGALKTALLLLWRGIEPTTGTTQVNQLRQELGLSPIKKVEESQGIVRIWELLINI